MTVNELLDALREAEGERADVPDAYTMGELIERTGRPRAWLQPRLNAAIRAGTVEPIYAPKQNQWGVIQGRPAYRFRKAA